MANIHNLFISHSWTYSDAYTKLCQLLDARAYFFYKNFSIPKDNPIHTNGTDKELLQAITNKIQLCHVVLIMAGVYSSYSKWINKEVVVANNSFNTPKPIIGIKPWAQTNVSKIVQDNAVEIVNWNTESIVAAIRRHSNA